MYTSKLPIATRTETILKRMFLLEETDTYQLSGKTGWAIRNGNNIGWFVGFVEKDDKLYYLATNVTPLDQNATKDFYIIRMRIALEALKKLSIL